VSVIFAGTGQPDLASMLDTDPWFLSAAADIDGWSDLVVKAARVDELDQRLALPIDGVAPNPAKFGRRLLDDPEWDITAAVRDALDRDRVVEIRRLVFSSAASARGQLAGEARAWLGSHSADLCDRLHRDRVATAVGIREAAAPLQGINDPEELPRRGDLATVMDVLVPLVDTWRHLRRLHHAIIGIDHRPAATGPNPARRWPQHDWAADLATGWPDFWRISDVVTEDAVNLGGQPFPWDDSSTLGLTQLMIQFEVVWTPLLAELERADDQLTRQAARAASAAISEYETKRAQGFPSPARESRAQVRTQHPPVDIEVQDLAAPSRIG
jgi:hypothetical protein